MTARTNLNFETNHVGEGPIGPKPTNDDPPDEVRFGWRLVDLGPVLAGDVSLPEPEVLATKDDRARFLYPGLVNGLHGGPGAGKTWVLLAAAAQELQRANAVIMVDAESNEDETTARLRALGVADDVIKRRFTYLKPEHQFMPADLDRIVTQITTSDAKTTLVIIDSVGELFAIEGLDENVDADVARWGRSVPRRFADLGPAVAVVDHGTKAADNVLMPSGSKRKVANITGAAYLVEALEAPTRDQPGRLRLICAKDRHGRYRKGDAVAAIDVTPYPDGGVSVNLWPITAEDDKPDVRLAAVGRALLKVLGQENRPLSQREWMALAKNVRASTDLKRAAIDHLAGLDCIAIERGERGASLHRRLTDYPDGES